MKRLLLTILTLLFLFINNIIWSQESNNSGSWKLFGEINKFPNKSISIQGGIGLNSIIAIREMAQINDGFDVKFLLPSMAVTVEKNIGNNIGAGISIGTQMWRVPKINAFNEEFKFKYRLLAIGSRLTYHFNLGKRWDSSMGIGLSFRYMDITRKYKSLDSNWHIGATTLFNIKYYFSDKWGVFLEIGSDTTSVYRFGVARNYQRSSKRKN